jgi:hypothetical protein
MSSQYVQLPGRGGYSPQGPRSTTSLVSHSAVSTRLTFWDPATAVRDADAVWLFVEPLQRPIIHQLHFWCGNLPRS